MNLIENAPLLQSCKFKGLIVLLSVVKGKFFGDALRGLSCGTFGNLWKGRNNRIF